MDAVYFVADGDKCDTVLENFPVKSLEPLQLLGDISIYPGISASYRPPLRAHFVLLALRQFVQLVVIFKTLCKSALISVATLSARLMLAVLSIIIPRSLRFSFRFFSSTVYCNYIISVTKYFMYLFKHSATIKHKTQL